MSEARERSALEVLRRLDDLAKEGHIVVMGPQDLTDPLWDDIDAVLRATPVADSYWWCPECREEVDASRVTYQELHDTCGTRVETRATPASDGGEVRGDAPAGATLYRRRCGWCGAYEGTVDPKEPCAKDEIGYIGPHQFEVLEAVVSGSGTPPGEGERGLIMRAMLETFPWSPDIRQGHFERAADAVIAALRSAPSGVEEEPVAWLVERRGVEMFRWHPVDVYLGRQHAENIARVMRDGEWDVRVVALYRATHPTDRSESDGE